MTDERRVVFAGADTHRDTIHVAVVDELGRHLGDQEFPTTSSGYAAAVAFISGYGPLDAVGVEGTASYGAGLATALRAAAITVVEVNQSDRAERRRRCKSDPLDAYAAARAAAAGRATATPKTRDGAVEAIRVLHVARASAVKARTQTINQLKNLLITAPAPLREAIPATTVQLVSTCARLRPGTDLTDPSTATKTALRMLARRYQHLTEEITTFDKHLETLTKTTAPQLVAIFGVGPETAAQLLITAGDNPDRLRSQAAFAHLCGTAPIPASSGQTRRHRLNRGGDRQANRALYVIALSRLAKDPRTQAYRDRRLKEGLTKKDVIRCLKRYIAREIHHALTVDKP